MAIDYQQILMQMNRPRRKQGGTWKKLLAVILFAAVFGGGGYAIWHYGLAGKTWNLALGVVQRLRGHEPAADAETAGAAEAAETPPSSPAAPIRPESALAMQPPADAPVDLAREASSAPRLAVPPTSAPAAPSAPSAPAPAAPQVPVRPVQPAQPAQSVRPAQPIRSAPAAGTAATPVLSDTKAQIRAIDQLLTSNPAEAMRMVEALLAGRLEPEDAAEVGYRRGYAARMLRDEALAEKSWKEAAEAYPALRGGRFSAMALADTWYQRYAGDRPQLSFWDDIQLMYSRAIGFDDAPFLPEPVKVAIKAKLTRLNDSLVFGSAPSKLARYHKVEPGELLGSIANKYRVDYESIARINGIDPNRIRVGMDLKLVVGDVSIFVRKHERELERTPTVTWFIDDRWVREYPACIGQGTKTPAGSYQLTSKERDPSWTNPANGQLLPNNHPENILGSRWMAMKGMNTQGLGIHGTTVDDSIPGYTSAGCVRLYNRDVEELFSFARINNKVVIYD